MGLTGLSSKVCTASVEIPNDIDIRLVCGPNDSCLKEAERLFPSSKVDMSNAELRLTAPDMPSLSALMNVMNGILNIARHGELADACQIRDLAHNAKDGRPVAEDYKTIVTYAGSAIKPKTHGQARYVDAICNSCVTICSAKAGTGKTYLAVACAVAALKNNEVHRIIITRPAVEAERENLGALPGTMEEKMDPYMRPIFDSLVSMASPEKVQAWIENGVIEIAPLAYMRGRTFDNAFVIADEMQNSTAGQAQMLLTRLGYNTKCVMEGDPGQTDRKGGNNGLLDAISVLKDVRGVSIVEMDSSDIVRSPIAAVISDAYDRRDSLN